jgi:MGT family glycosyltransferase
MSVWKSPWAPTDDRPLVLVSFSTGPYWDQSSRILRTLKALAHVDCRVLVTAGLAKIDPELVPGNAIVIARIRHDEILSKAALTVTHAGHGTVITSLKHGVPLLCLPNPVADQPILAAQVESLGCGVSLDGDKATSDDIKEATDRLLNDPYYAARARVMAETISQKAGVIAAVAELERLFGRSTVLANVRK